MKTFQFMTSTFLAILFCSGCDTVSAIAYPTQALSVAATTSKKVSFTDIDEHWAKESIEKAVTKDYVDGYEDKTFRPEQHVSRAEFIKMVATATNLKVSKAGDGEQWYDPYMRAAVAAGYIRTDEFKDEEYPKEIKRVEMARISVRAATKDLQNPAVHMDDLSFVYNATKTGLMQGLSAGELGLAQLTTRAQSVTVIERILAVAEGHKLPVDKYALSNAAILLKKTNVFSMWPEVFGGDQFENKRWDASNTSIKSQDGKYEAMMDAMILIDMEDPNDRNSGFLGDMSQLQWVTGAGPKNRVPTYLSNYPKSYVLFFKTHVVKNDDPENYLGEPHMDLAGFVSPDIKARYKGELNGAMPLYMKIPGDYKNAYIIPKSGFIANGSVLISIRVPKRGETEQRDLVQILLNKQ